MSDNLPGLRPSDRHRLEALEDEVEDRLKEALLRAKQECWKAAQGKRFPPAAQLQRDAERFSVSGYEFDSGVREKHVEYGRAHVIALVDEWTKALEYAIADIDSLAAVKRSLDQHFRKRPWRNDFAIVIEEQFERWEEKMWDLLAKKPTPPARRQEFELNAVEFGQLLQETRTATNKTQADIADPFKVTPETWSRWETGKRLPSKKHLPDLESWITEYHPKGKSALESARNVTPRST